MKKEFFSSLMCFSLLFAASCAHTPDKMAAVVTSQIETEQMLPTEQPSEDHQESQTMIENNQPNSPAVTVTPLILQVQQRGTTQTIAEIPSMVTYPTVTGSVQNLASGLSDGFTMGGSSPVVGTTVLPREAFYVTLTLKNTGTTTWMQTFDIVDYGETTQSVQKNYDLSYAVAPGGTYVFTVYLTAPQYEGTYKTMWRIENASDVPFGYFEYSFKVGTFSSITSVATLTATITPTFYSTQGYTATPQGGQWMCIDMERSIQVGQNCESFCPLYWQTVPRCYIRGVLYATATPAPTAIPATAAPTEAPATQIPTETPAGGSTGS